MENKNLYENFKKDFNKSNKLKLEKINNELVIIKFYNETNKIINNYMYILNFENLTEFLIKDYKLKLSENFLLSKLLISNLLETKQQLYIN